MKLNHDCIRDCLIFYEDNLNFDKSIYPSEVAEKLIEKYTADDIQYSILQLSEIGFIDGGVYQIKTISGSHYGEKITTQLTWEGHKYLDTIRDQSVWNKSKEVASNFKSVPLSMMSTIGSQIILSLINKSIGL